MSSSHSSLSKISPSLVIKAFLKTILAGFCRKDFLFGSVIFTKMLPSFAVKDGCCSVAFLMMFCFSGNKASMASSAASRTISELS